MSNRYAVDKAVTLARGLPVEASSFNSPVLGLIEMVRKFSVIEFDVPDISDADGYLFQYGKVGWFSEPTFALSIVRQLEVVDFLGEHESYIQIFFEYTYPLDGGLEGMGQYSEWWFPGNGTSFDTWLESVGQASIVEVIASRTPLAFEVYQEQT